MEPEPWAYNNEGVSMRQKKFCVMKYPTTRFVFDRKKTATRNKTALVQVEILYERKKKYVSTGVKVYKDQWNDKSHVVNCDDWKSRARLTPEGKRR